MVSRKTSADADYILTPHPISPEKVGEIRKVFLDRYKGLRDRYGERTYKLNVYTVHKVTVEAGSDEEAKAKALLEVYAGRATDSKCLAIGPFPRPKEEDGTARATENAHENS